jgi:hypothetical protein
MDDRQKSPEEIRAALLAEIEATMPVFGSTPAGARSLDLASNDDLRKLLVLAREGAALGKAEPTVWIEPEEPTPSEAQAAFRRGLSE